jgi:Amidohydrolase
MGFASAGPRGAGELSSGRLPNHRWIFRVLLAAFVLCAVCCPSWRVLPSGESAEDIPILDAHNQYDEGLTAEEMIALMDAAGVQRTFFSARGHNGDAFVLHAADLYPKRILPLIWTKGNSQFEADTNALARRLQQALKDKHYYGIAELLVFHAEKDFNSGVVMPQRAIMPDDPKVALVAGIDASRKWPLLLHIEFGQTGDLRQTYMEKFEQLLTANPNLPIVLMHMGQLDPDEANRLIAAHQNLYFITGRVNYGSNGPQLNPHQFVAPWTVMFQQDKLVDGWRQLFVKYPDRFIYATDNVQVNDWRKGYVNEVRHWRQAFAELPPDVANDIAHQNAERLWHLPPP